MFKKNVPWNYLVLLSSIGYGKIPILYYFTINVYSIFCPLGKAVREMYPRLILLACRNFSSGIENSKIGNSNQQKRDPGTNRYG